MVRGGDAGNLIPVLVGGRLPSPADFARLGVAVERVLKWQEGSFLDALEATQSNSLMDALDAEPVAAVLVDFAEDHGEWTGTATKLLRTLTGRVPDEAIARQRQWPRNAAQLGIKLRRLAPALRKLEVVVDFAPSGRDKSKRRGVTVRYLGYQGRSGDDGDSGDGANR